MKAKDILIKFHTCNESIDWAGDMSVKEAWASCPRGDWMLWFAVKLQADKGKIFLVKSLAFHEMYKLMKDERSRDTVLAIADASAAAYYATAGIYTEAAEASNIILAIAEASAGIDTDAAGIYTCATTYDTLIQKSLLKSAEVCRKILTDEICRKLSGGAYIIRK